VGSRRAAAARGVVDANEKPIKLTPPNLWTLDQMRGLVRHTLGDDAGKLGPARCAALADRGRRSPTMAGGRAARPRRDVLTAYDATRDTRGALGQAVTQAVDGDGLVIGGRRRHAPRWTPGHDQLMQIGRLPGAPSAFSITDRFVVAQLDPGRLSRFDLASHQRGDAAFRDPVHDVAITREGRAWIATEHGELWRWEPAAPPVRVERSEPVDRLVITGGRILGHTSRSLVALDREPPRAVQVDARATRLDGRRLRRERRAERGGVGDRSRDRRHHHVARDHVTGGSLRAETDSCSRPRSWACLAPRGPRAARAARCGRPAALAARDHERAAAGWRPGRRVAVARYLSSTWVTISKVQFACPSVVISPFPFLGR